MTCIFLNNNFNFIGNKTTRVELKNSVTFQSHKDAVSAVTIIADGMEDENLVSVGRDGVLKIYSLKTEKLTRSIALSSIPLCSCVYYKTLSNVNVLVVGSCDNSLYVLTQIIYLHLFN
jgi:factor associated with neutral sphingomyelinase activation